VLKWYKNVSFVRHVKDQKEVQLMWRVVYMAQTKTIADQITDLLNKEGFLIKVKPVYKNVPDEENYYEILVPQTEVQEVHDILMENGY